MTGIETALAAAAVKEVASPAASALAKLGREAFDSLSSKFASCFQGHINATQKKCSKIKNILYKDDSVPFDSQYVAVDFTHKNATVKDRDVLRLALDRQKVLISGTAGAGKTMFMRWSALRLIEGISNHGRIPLFLEMRYADKRIAFSSLDRYIFDRTSSEDESSSFGQFKNGLKDGLFVIILDAIDEIIPELRKSAVESILDFVQKYPKCSLLVSTRPEETLRSVQEFTVFHTAPMSLDQIIEVIENLEYDDEVRASLIAKLKDGLYDKLDEFLSNPLLATIMLLSFDFGGDVPDKLTGFYKQAFDALYLRHDAAKGAYKREHYADLSLDEFHRVFSAFCFETYMSFKFEFSDAELLEYFSSAIEYEGLDCKAQLVAQDARESVCLILREGWDNVFSHRSFQEYFCALFIANFREGGVGELISKLMSMEANSNVAKMLFELSPELFEYEWVLPLLDEIIEKLGRVRPDTKTGLAKFIDEIGNSIYPNTDTGFIEYVGWGPAYRKNQPLGYKLSSTESAMGRKNLGYRELFGGAIWDDLFDYIAELPIEVRPDIEDVKQRIERMPFGERDDERDEADYVGLYSADAPWLIQSKLPDRYRAVMAKIRESRADIISRRAERRSAVGDLLKKVKRRGTDFGG